MNVHAVPILWSKFLAVPGESVANDAALTRQRAEFEYSQGSTMAKGTQSPAQQLATWMDAYEPEIRKRAAAALKELRAQVPGATEMVYDTFNALVIGFAPGERPSEAILSIGLYPRWVNLYFLEGAFLDDPEHRLKGSGNRVRTLRLDDAAILREPAVKALIAAAVANADPPFAPTRRRRLVIKSSVSRRRPRRPASR